MPKATGLAASLRAERARRQWTQEEAADFFGCQRQTYAKFEQREDGLDDFVTVALLRKVATFLNVPERSVLELIPRRQA